MRKNIIILIGLIFVVTTILFGQTRRTRDEGYLRQTIISFADQPINRIIKVCDPDAGIPQIPTLNGISKPPLEAVLNRDHPLAQGLTGAWIFNEGSGTIIYDKTGARNATLGTGGVWTPSGIELDGSVNSKISLSNKYIPSQPQYWSVVARYRYDAINKSIVSAGDGQVYAFNILTNEKLSTRTQENQGILTKTSGYFTPPQSRTWVVIRSGNVIRWYRDGLQIGVAITFTGSSASAWQVDYLTGGVDGQNALDGLLEYVYLYDRSLTSTEISQLYVQPYTIFSMPLIYTNLMTISSDNLPFEGTLGRTYILPQSEVPNVMDPLNGYSVELQIECSLPTASWYGANFYWKPNYTLSGEYPIYFHAVDNKGGDDWVIYNLIIQNVNRPPQL